MSARPLSAVHIRTDMVGSCVLTPKHLEICPFLPTSRERKKQSIAQKNSVRSERGARPSQALLSVSHAQIVRLRSLSRDSGHRQIRMIPASDCSFCTVNYNIMVDSRFAKAGTDPRYRCCGLLCRCQPSHSLSHVQYRLEQEAEGEG